MKHLLGLALAGLALSRAAIAETGASRWEVAGVRSSGGEPGVAVMADGRALFCGGASGGRPASACEAWSPVDGRWSPAPALAVPREEPALGVASDGAVWAAGGRVWEEPRTWRRSTRVEVWPPQASGWQPASDLPDEIEGLRLFAQPDGRMAAVSSGGCRLQIWEASRRSPWALVALEGAAHVCPTGVRALADHTLVFSVWHEERRAFGFAIRRAGSRTLTTTWLSPTLQPDHHLVDWDARRSLLLSWRDDRWTARFVDAAGGGESIAVGALPASLRPVSTGDGVVLFAAERQQWRWRPGGAPEREAPGLSAWRAMARPRPGLILAAPAAPANDLVLAWSATPPERPACAGLEQFLQTAIEGRTAPAWWLDRYAAERIDLVQRAAQGACREALARGAAPALAARLREWAEVGDVRVRVAAALACGLSLPGAVPAIERWLTASVGEEPWKATRVACLIELSQRPEGQAAFAAVALRSVREVDGRWEVDPALARAMGGSAAARARAAEPLAAARAHRAAGHDDLWRAVCRTDPATADATVCRAGLQEAEWAEKQGRGGRFWAVAGATAIAGGLVTAAHYTRHQDLSRGIATGSGGLGGLTLGVTVGALVGAIATESKRGEGAGVGAALGGLAAAALGGYAAYGASAAPGARAVTTAAGLAIPYFVVLLLATE